MIITKTKDESVKDKRVKFRRGGRHVWVHELVHRRRHVRGMRSRPEYPSEYYVGDGYIKP